MIKFIKDKFLPILFTFLLSIIGTSFWLGYNFITDVYAMQGALQNNYRQDRYNRIDFLIYKTQRALQDVQETIWMYQKQFGFSLTSASNDDKIEYNKLLEKKIELKEEIKRLKNNEEIK